MPATYEPIATTTLSSAQSSVTFSSISGTYTDLVLVIQQITATADNPTLQFNGDTTTNYSSTILYGTGSAAGSARQSNTATPYLSYYGSVASTPNVTIVNIMNYANTNTYKTAIARAGVGSSGGGTDAIAILWRKTPEAITSILIKQVGGNNYSSGSTFTLYGIKAA